MKKRHIGRLGNGRKPYFCKTSTFNMTILSFAAKLACTSVKKICLKKKKKIQLG